MGLEKHEEQEPGVCFGSELGLPSSACKLKARRGVDSSARGGTNPAPFTPPGSALKEGLGTGSDALDTCQAVSGGSRHLLPIPRKLSHGHLRKIKDNRVGH